MASSRPIAAGSPRLPRRWAPLRAGLTLGRRARQGEQAAFAEIFSKHHQEIYRYCLAILGNPSDAEDALQSTMSAALRALPGEDREVELRPWLFRVAHNEAISIVRSRRETQLDCEPTAGRAESPAAELESRDRLRHLVEDLKGLPERQRSALVMRELSGLGYGEIAAALDCAEGAARQSVYEARMALRGREEGREMRCDEVRRAVSDGDGRRLRGRRLKAHLRACEGCAGFKLAIEVRRQDLRALCPPLPIAAAGGVLAGLGIGGAGSAGAATGVAAVGSGAAALGGGVAAGASVKAATVVAAVIVAAGASDAAGIVELPGPLHVGSEAGSEAAPATGTSDRSEPEGGQGAGHRGIEASGARVESRGRGDKRQGRAGDARGRTRANGSGRGEGLDRRPGKGPGRGVGGRGEGPPAQPPGPPASGGPPANVGPKPGGGPPAPPPAQPAKPETGGAGGGGGAPPAVVNPPGGGPPPAAGGGRGKGGAPE
jgi:RNA polymerase sigma factor (sigma-70 family)